MITGDMGVADAGTVTNNNAFEYAEVGIFQRARCSALGETLKDRMGDIIPI